MAVDCDPNSLMEQAKCFKCIPNGIQMEIQTYLLAVIAGGSTDPAVLMEQAKCFRCIPQGMQAEVQTMLLCNIVNS